MLTNRTSFISQHPELKEGMTVHSSDGNKLGRVISLDEDSLTIQKGIFFPRDFMIRYDDIEDIQSGVVHLSVSSADLAGWREDSYEGWRQTEEINAGRLAAEPRERVREKSEDRERPVREQINIPIVEEELEAQKVARQTGELQVRKIVHTELKHFTVPVSREEVRVERVPVTEREATPATGDTSFQEKTIRVPVMEEEVTVSKRPVVKEEIRVSKERVTEERGVEGEVRKEEIRIEGEDQLKRKKAG